MNIKSIFYFYRRRICDIIFCCLVLLIININEVLPKALSQQSTKNGTAEIKTHKKPGKENLLCCSSWNSFCMVWNQLAPLARMILIFWNKRKSGSEKITTWLRLSKIIKKQMTLHKKKIFLNNDIFLINVSTIITFITNARNSYFLSSLNSLLNLDTSHLRKALTRTLTFILSVQTNTFQIFFQKTKRKWFFIARFV